MVKELEDEKIRITLLEVRKDEREKRIKQRLMKNEKSMCELLIFLENKEYDPTLQDRGEFGMLIYRGYKRAEKGERRPYPFKI